MKAVPSRSRKMCSGLSAAGISLSSDMLLKTKTPSCISGFMLSSSVLRLRSPGIAVCTFKRSLQVAHRSAAAYACKIGGLRFANPPTYRVGEATPSAHDDFADLDDRRLVGIVRDVG